MAMLYLNEILRRQLVFPSESLGFSFSQAPEGVISQDVMISEAFKASMWIKELIEVGSPFNGQDTPVSWDSHPLRVLAYIFEEIVQDQVHEEEGRNRG